MTTNTQIELIVQTLTTIRPADQMPVGTPAWLLAKRGPTQDAQITDANMVMAEAMYRGARGQEMRRAAKALTRAWINTSADALLSEALVGTRKRADQARAMHDTGHNSPAVWFSRSGMIRAELARRGITA